MYVDGAVRLGVFGSILLNNAAVVEEIRKAGLKINLRVIMNGNMSSLPVLPDLESNGGKPDATLIGVGGASLNNMLDQIYRDSAYRTEMDLRVLVEDRDLLDSRFTYIANEDIRASSVPQCLEWIELRRKKIRQGSAIFEPPFMRCLYWIGYERGIDQKQKKAWLKFNEIPAVLLNNQ
jgi:hypothetical protein